MGGALPVAAARVGLSYRVSAGSIRSAFVAMTLLTVASMPFLVRLAGAAGLKPTKVFPVRDLLRVDTVRFARFLLPGRILGIGAGMYLNFIQLYLLQRFGLTPGPIGAIFAVGAAATALTTLGAPRISRRLGVARTIGLLQVAGSPLVLSLAFLTVLAIAVLILYVRQITLTLLAPPGQVFGWQFV